MMTRLVLFIPILLALFALDAWAGWRLVDLDTVYEADNDTDFVIAPPLGGEAKAEMESSGKIIQGTASAWDWTLIDSVKAKVAVSGFYAERWEWKAPNDPFLEPYAEFGLMAESELTGGLTASDSSIEHTSTVETKVRCGGQYRAANDIRVHESTGILGAFVSAGAGGVGIGVTPSGIGGHAGTLKVPRQLDRDVGDVCLQKLYYETHRAFGTLSAYADGGVGGMAACSVSMTGESGMDYRWLGEIYNCTQGG
ncbi:MAG: hypothetical protein V2A76_09560 [Planctomycetota bacterium]